MPYFYLSFFCRAGGSTLDLLSLPVDLKHYHDETQKQCTAINLGTKPQHLTSETCSSFLISPYQHPFPCSLLKKKKVFQQSGSSYLVLIILICYWGLGWSFAVYLPYVLSIISCAQHKMDTKYVCLITNYISDIFNEWVVVHCLICWVCG